MNDEFTEEELDNVMGGYQDFELSVKAKIDKLERELENPNNGPYEREQIKEELEGLKVELENYNKKKSL